MSRPKTLEPEASVGFDCRMCHTPYWISKESINKYECDSLPLDLMNPERGVPTRCTTCVRIYQATVQLKNLVLMKPHLLTDGAADEPEVPSWDKEPEQDTKSNSAEESLGDGMDDAERKKFLEKMVQSFKDTAGMGLTEEEVYGNDYMSDLCKSLAGTEIKEAAKELGMAAAKQRAKRAASWIED
jgi:hypothetical protein